MNSVKVLKSAQEHRVALARIAELMDADPAEGTPEADELELLALLVDRYEEDRFPVGAPDPVEAIRFRMDQMGLRNKDLVPYIGSASKVSEVLNGKRDLSLNMVRKLSHGLGIPADVLIRDTGRMETGRSALPGERFPLSDMRKRGYFAGFEGSLQELREYACETVSNFVDSVPGGRELEPALLRTTAHVRSNDKTTDPFALWAWQVRVLQKAYEQRLPARYQQGTVTPEWMRRLAQLSWSEKGPHLAVEYLTKSGIHFVVERHLPKTYLDGAACRTRDGAPVVALTLRYDRTDSFWFTLLHELSHVALHIDGTREWFVDDLEAEDTSPIERDADTMASEALIPSSVWETRIPSATHHVEQLARDLGISPSIIAGRARHETGDHRLFGTRFRDRLDREALGWEEQSLL